MALEKYNIALGAIEDENGKNYISGKAVYIRNKDTNALIDIFADAGGLMPIPQNGVNNVSDNVGMFSFWVEAGRYKAVIDAIDYYISVLGIEYFQNEADAAVAQAVANFQPAFDTFLSDSQSTFDSYMASLAITGQQEVDQLVADLTASGNAQFAAAISGFNSAGNAAIETLKGSQGFEVVGTFAAGATYTKFNDVIQDDNGNPWVYIGDESNYPVTVTAGTDPSALPSLYAQRGYNDVADLVNVDKPNQFDNYYTRRVQNIDELKALEVDSSMIGNRIFINEYHAGTGYGGGEWKIATGESANDIDVIQSDINANIQYKHVPLLGVLYASKIGLSPVTSLSYRNSVMLQMENYDVIELDVIGDISYSVSPNFTAKTVRGMGEMKTTLKPSGIGYGLSIIGDDPATQSYRTNISDLTIEGDGGASGLLINISNYTKLENINIRNFPSGSCIKMLNTQNGNGDPRWTERTTFENVTLANGNTCLDFDVQGGTASFGYTRIFGLQITVFAGQSGIRLRNGAQPYNSEFFGAIWLNDPTSKGLHIETGGLFRNNFVDLSMEDFSNGADGIHIENSGVLRFCTGKISMLTDTKITDNGNFNTNNLLIRRTTSGSDSMFLCVNSLTDPDFEIDEDKIVNKNTISKLTRDFDVVSITGSTPDVGGGNTFSLSNSTATDVTGFANMRKGQHITVRFADNNTTIKAVSNGGSIRTEGNLDLVCTTNSVCEFYFDGIDVRQKSKLIQF